MVAEGTRLIDDTELALYLALKREAMGGVGAWPTMLVPFQEQGDWQRALAVLQFVVDRLRARSVPVQVQTRPTSAGSVFQLTLSSAAS